MYLASPSRKHNIFLLMTALAAGLLLISPAVRADEAGEVIATADSALSVTLGGSASATIEASWSGEALVEAGVVKSINLRLRLAGATKDSLALALNLRGLGGMGYSSEGNSPERTWNSAIGGTLNAVLNLSPLDPPDSMEVELAAMGGWFPDVKDPEDSYARIEGQARIAYRPSQEPQGLAPLTYGKASLKVVKVTYVGFPNGGSGNSKRNYWEWVESVSAGYEFPLKGRLELGVEGSGKEFPLKSVDNSHGTRVFISAGWAFNKDNDRNSDQDNVWPVRFDGTLECLDKAYPGHPGESYNSLKAEGLVSAKLNTDDRAEARLVAGVKRYPMKPEKDFRRGSASFLFTKVLDRGVSLEADISHSAKIPLLATGRGSANTSISSELTVTGLRGVRFTIGAGFKGVRYDHGSDQPGNWDGDQDGGYDMNTDGDRVDRNIWTLRLRIEYRLSKVTTLKASCSTVGTRYLIPRTPGNLGDPEDSNGSRNRGNHESLDERETRFTLGLTHEW